MLLIDNEKITTNNMELMQLMENENCDHIGLHNNNPNEKNKTIKKYAVNEKLNIALQEYMHDMDAWIDDCFV